MNLHPDHSVLHSPRLTLINSTPDILEQILKGNESLATYLGIRIPVHWSEFGEAPFMYMQEQVLKDPLSVEWWSWLPVLNDGNILAGNCGYKGLPKEGIVEIGYEVARDYRQKGLATEIAHTLIHHAFGRHDVHTVIAHTLPQENESVRVLKKCGFQFDGTIEDPDDGSVWRWRLRKPGAATT